jgi:hypothetical protein
MGDYEVSLILIPHKGVNYRFDILNNHLKVVVIS